MHNPSKPLPLHSKTETHPRSRQQIQRSKPYRENRQREVTENLKDFKTRHEQASILLDYVIESGFDKRAWRIYFEWRDGKITYQKALRKLKRLAKRKHRRQNT